MDGSVTRALPSLNLFSGMAGFGMWEASCEEIPLKGVEPNQLQIGCAPLIGCNKTPPSLGRVSYPFMPILYIRYKLHCHISDAIAKYLKYHHCLPRFLLV